MCWPRARAEVENAAAPELSVTVASGVTPSSKVIEPVGDDPVTVAVNLTVAPTSEGFALEISAVLELCCITCDSTVEVLVKLKLSPPYTAVIECVPAARVDV